MEKTELVHKDHVVKTRGGWGMLAVNILCLLGAIALIVFGIYVLANPTVHFIDDLHVEVERHNGPGFTMLFGGILVLVATIISLVGHFTLQPNEGRVQVLFGAYKGTVLDSGFHWANPFYSKVKTKVSVRTRNFQSDVIKVNDLRGNPIEIAAVVVWRVDDLAMAKFDVDDYKSYVRIQSESAIRHLAGSYAYDRGETKEELTLRDGGEQVLAALRNELQERLGKAGVIVDEARITHLAYAQEIAQAMLKRQQAEAIIAARKKIVRGAVSMVGQALTELSDGKIVEFDDDKRATMVSNLLVVLCGDSDVSPVINTGTLYQ